MTAPLQDLRCAFPQNNVRGEASAVALDQKAERFARFVAAADTEKVGGFGQRLTVCLQNEIALLNAGFVTSSAVSPLSSVTGAICTETPIITSPWISP